MPESIPVIAWRRIAEPAFTESDVRSRSAAGHPKAPRLLHRLLSDLPASVIRRSSGSAASSWLPSTGGRDAEERADCLEPMPSASADIAEPVEELDLGRCQLEVEDRGVLGDALGVRRLRDRDDLVLDVPAEHDLRRSDAVLLRDCTSRGSRRFIVLSGL